MLKKLLRRLKKFLRLSKPELYPGKRADFYYGEKVGNVTIETHSQMVKHTEFKPGETYRVGQMLVTVHATKEDMLKAIAAVDAKREAKHKALTERAIDIMLMDADQVELLKVKAFLEANKAKDSMFKRIMGRYWNKTRHNHFVQLEAKYAEAAPKATQAVEADDKAKVKIVEKA